MWYVITEEAVTIQNRPMFTLQSYNINIFALFVPWQECNKYIENDSRKAYFAFYYIQ